MTKESDRVSKTVMGLAASRVVGGLVTRPIQKKADRVEANRNDPCPCGSGRKFKKCCLVAEQDAQLFLEREKKRLSSGTGSSS